MKNGQIKVLPCKDGSPKPTRNAGTLQCCAEAEQSLHDVANHKDSVGPMPPVFKQARCLNLTCHVEYMD